MTKFVFHYDIEELIPYIDWSYFFHAWGLEGKENDKKAMEERLMMGEDGLPGEFCAQMRSYNAAQLRLILDEQADLYNAEETAYIRKVLAEKDRTV